MSPQLPDEALRLVLTYRSGEIKLDDVLKVSMRLVPSEPLDRPAGEPLSGFWIELQTGEGKPLYRRAMRNPMRLWVDLPDEEDKKRLVHLESEEPAEETSFMVDVPNLPEAVQVVLFSSPLKPPWETEPAEQLGRIWLPQA